MACRATVGLGRPACPGETPGARDTVYLYNVDDVTAYTLSGNVITGITFSSGTGFLQYVGRKGSVVVREEKQDNETGATDYLHEVDIHFTDLSSTCRDAINDLNGATLGAIVATKGDKFILLGYNEGLEMKVNTMTTEAEGLGEFITLRETQVNEKTRRFLVTDVSTTETYILSRVVAS